MSREFRPRVVVLGGGLAGITAAEVLALAEFDVTLLEKGPTLGGKVQGWESDGYEFEHGVHGFWPNYHNLFGLLQRAGLRREDIFRRSSGTTLVMEDGKRYFSAPLSREIPPPFHLLVHVLKAPYLRLIDKLSLMRAGLEMLAFEHSKDYAEYDGVTFRGWLWSRGVSRRAYERLFEPWVRALTFDSASRVSAAAVLSSFHHYLLRGQHDVEPYWLTKNPRFIFDALQTYLEKIGVNVVLEAEVQKLNLDASLRINDVEYQLRGTEEFEGSKFQEIFSIAENEIKDGGFYTRPASSAWPTIHLRRRGNDLLAFDGTCPHALNMTDCSANGFRCPVHDSTFDTDGFPISGPAKEALRRFDVRCDNGGWTVQARNLRLHHETEYVVSAVDLAAFQKLVPLDMLNHQLFRGIETLETSPVVVGRFWFKELDVIPFTSGLLAGDHLLDAFFVLPRGVNGETIVEGQAYLVRDTACLESDVLRELFLKDLRIALPALNNTAPIRHYIGNYSNPNLFSLYRAGSDAFRPSSETPIPNLFLAGDWVHVEWPVWNMERAVLSGINSAGCVMKVYGRDPSDPTEPLREILQQSEYDSGRWFKRTRGIARCYRRMQLWWRRIRASAPLVYEPVRNFVAFKADKPELRYRIRFHVKKAVGTPREQIVRGTMDFSFKESDLKIDRNGPVATAKGQFRVDLQTIDTRLRERDERLLSELLKVQRERYAFVEITDVRNGSERGIFDVGLQVKIGERTIPISAKAHFNWKFLLFGMTNLELVVTVAPRLLVTMSKILPAASSLKMQWRLGRGLELMPNSSTKLAKRPKKCDGNVPTRKSFFVRQIRNRSLGLGPAGLTKMALAQQLSQNLWTCLTKSRS